MKRFTETVKWDDGWYRRLTPIAKCFWQFICDKCDCAGVIDIDFELASFSVGGNVDQSHVQEIGERMVKLVSGKYLIPKFVGFQYGELSEACPAHKPIFKRIKEHGFSVSGSTLEYPNARLLNTLPDDQYPKATLAIGYRKGKEEERKGKEEGDARGRRLHGIPATVEEVIAFGETIHPKKTADECRDFFAFYEGIARTSPDGAIFWVTGGENGAVITNWKAKLPGFSGAKSHGTQNRRTHVERVDRNIGTCNEGSAADYRGMGVPSTVPNVRRPDP